MPDPQEHRWPCESCGSDLRFTPGQTVLKCDHCGNVQTIPQAARADKISALLEHDLRAGLRDDLPASTMADQQTTQCPNCGALVEFQGAEHATQCPFCATPVVVGTGTHRQFKPQAVLPFVLKESEARAAMVTWLGRLWFAPNGLVEYTRKGRALSGIYVPYWTFDADTRSRYSGKRGTYYYETRTVMVEVNGRREARQEQVRRTRWQSVRGQVSRFFDDVVVLASRSLPLAYTEALAPWDLSHLQPYSADYLAGFTAEGYTVALADGSERAHEIMHDVIQGDIRRDIGGDEQQIDGVDTDYSAETFKHILLPIWMAAYKYNGRSYRFVVNGQTGKVKGERPWSIWKITFATIAAAIVIGTVVYLNEVPR